MAVARMFARCVAPLVVLLGLGLGFSSVSAQTIPPDDTVVEQTPGLGNIVGSPEPGPDPSDAGDRGGWAQLGLAVALFGAIAFIGFKVFGSVRSTGPPG